MKQLTQEDAKRCARNCGIEIENRKGRFLAWYYDVEGYLGLWVLPTDPYFWRPRLEDRLISLAEAQGREVQIYYYPAWKRDWLESAHLDNHKGNSHIWIGVKGGGGIGGNSTEFEKNFFFDECCPVFCAVIEQLKEKDE